MKVIDLTHTISPGMPVYPGTKPPEFSKPCMIDNEGFEETKITLYSHTGTHLDAPSHLLPRGRSLEEFPLERFYGKAIVLDVSETGTGEIGIDKLGPHSELIKTCDFVLLHTGWERYWGSEAYFLGYPVLSTDAAAFLASFDLKGVGMDTISPDKVGSLDFPVHKILFDREILTIENLANLGKLTGETFNFFCFPLKFEDSDGSPLRAAAILDES